MIDKASWEIADSEHANNAEFWENTNATYVSTWNQFSKKYNQLADIMERSGIDISLVDEVIELRNQLSKIKITLKIDDLFKI